MASKERFISDIMANQALIYKIAAYYTNSKEDREDLTQEIIYNLWKSYDGFNKASSLCTWMYRVALNVSIYHFRKDKKRPLSRPLDENDHSREDVADDGMEEKYLLIQNQVSELNLFDKGILLLYLEDKSHEEIAEIIGISISNVGTKLSRIKERLRKQIKAR